MNNTETKSLFVIVLGLGVFSILLKIDALLYTALAIGIVGLSIEPIGKFIVMLWMKLAEALGWFNSRVILGALFFLILMPIAFLYRLSNRNPMNRFKTDGSIFVERNHRYTAKDLENPW